MIGGIIGDDWILTIKNCKYRVLSNCEVSIRYWTRLNHPMLIRKNSSGYTIQSSNESSKESI